MSPSFKTAMLFPPPAGAFGGAVDTTEAPCACAAAVAVGGSARTAIAARDGDGDEAPAEAVGPGKAARSLVRADRDACTIDRAVGVLGNGTDDTDELEEDEDAATDVEARTGEEDDEVARDDALPPRTAVYSVRDFCAPATKRETLDNQGSLVVTVAAVVAEAAFVAGGAWREELFDVGEGEAKRDFFTISSSDSPSPPSCPCPPLCKPLPSCLRLLLLCRPSPIEEGEPCR